MMREQIITAANMMPPRPYTGIGIQFFILILVLIIIVWLLKDSKKTPYKINEKDTALDILKKRYASGEITKKQYDEIRKDIADKEEEKKEISSTGISKPAAKKAHHEKTNEDMKKDSGEI